MRMLVSLGSCLRSLPCRAGFQPLLEQIRGELHKPICGVGAGCSSVPDAGEDGMRPDDGLLELVCPGETGLEGVRGAGGEAAQDRHESVPLFGVIEGVTR